MKYIEIKADDGCVYEGLVKEDDPVNYERSFLSRVI